MAAKKHHEQPAPRPLQVGDWVHIDGMAGVGRIVQLIPARRRALVEIRHQTWEMAVKKLSAASAPPPGKEEPAVQLTTYSALAYEVDLHGLRVEEALEQADRALDQAVAGGLDRLKIIHGHGTGALRKAIRQMLSNHPHVESYRFGDPHEGGLACTVATLHRTKQ